MAYVLPSRGSWTYSAVTQVTASAGRGVRPDACLRCGSTRLMPLDDRDDE
jgi:hypothetical protein